jgi:hypothetical protein
LVDLSESNPRGRTPLNNACSWGNVEKGADPNGQDHTGLTPLWCVPSFECSWCGDISAELAYVYHGRQYNNSI